ncbi:MAG: SWIM zinc finger family protein [Streptosporangiaceae bacterium]
MEARGFPAFGVQRRGRRFAESWWGRAWVRALEETSLDHTLLSKGRAYAKAGELGPITVSPGRISVHVQEDETVTTVVRVERLTEPQWVRFLDEVAAQAGHIAALLDGDMPPDLVAAAQDAGVPLLPAVGDLEPDCDCTDWEYPCKHAAALCYQASWLLDADPFLLLLMRGRGARELLAGLRDRNAAPRPAATTGIPARAAFAAPVAPLPALPPVPGPVSALWVDGPPGSDPEELTVLVAAAAAKARDLLGWERAEEGRHE